MEICMQNIRIIALHLHRNIGQLSKNCKYRRKKNARPPLTATVRWKLTECLLVTWSHFTLSQLRRAKAAKNWKGQKRWKLTCKRNVSKEEIKIVEMKCKNPSKELSRHVIGYLSLYHWLPVLNLTTNISTMGSSFSNKTRMSYSCKRLFFLRI